MEMEIINTLTIATLTVCAWSVLYRENVIYRVIEHLTLGVMFGYSLSIAVDTLWNKTFIPIFTEGDVMLGIVAIIGFLLWLRLVPGMGYFSRIPLALLSGISMAVGIRGALSAQILRQTLVGSWFTDGGINVNNIIIGVFAITSIIYFVYTQKRAGIMGPVTRIGRIGLMFMFGVTIGTQLMGNTNFSVGQMPYLVKGYGAYVTALALIIIAIDIVYRRTKVSTTTTTTTETQV